MSIKAYAYILFVLGVITSCKKSVDSPSNSLKITLDHQFDGQPFLLHENYQNELGQSFSVDQFKYYLSNIRLRNSTTGEYWIEPDSYHLVIVSQNDQSNTINLSGLPNTAFNELEFAIGVDNVSNHALDHLGALDPANEMAWNWNTGYKFLLLEGQWSDNQDNNSPLVFHIGLDRNYKSFTFNAINSNLKPLNFNNNTSEEITISVNLAEIFKNPYTIDFSTTNSITSGEEMSTIADNYSNNMLIIN